MPCRDWDYDCNTENAYTNGQNDSKKLLEPLLCEACSLLEESGILQKMSPELLKWYKEHETREEDRVRLEAAQKLSERERRLLGIDLKKLADYVPKKR